MSMTVEYRFTSLTSLADWLENKAKELRTREPHGRNKTDTKVRQAEYRGEAIAHESIAHLLRNCKIGAQ